MLLLELFRLDERLQTLEEVLEPLKDDKTIFISYSEVMKVGIYPSSVFNTPVGIYAYPLHEMYQSIITRTVPFAGYRKYVHVLKLVGNTLDLARYGAGDYTRDGERLRDLYAKHVRLDDVLKAYLLFPIRGPRVKAEDADALVASVQADPDKLWTLFVGHAESESKIKDASGYIWNLTRNIARVMGGGAGRPVDSPIAVPRGAVLWNAVLRSIGYDAVVDRHGFGIIHNNEPQQAVFLTAKAVQLVASHHNNVFRGGVRVNPVRDFGSFVEFENMLREFTEETDAKYYWIDDHKRMLNATVTHMLAEWSTFRELGRSEHFRLEHYTLDEFSKDIAQNWAYVSRAFTVMSSRLNELLVWEVMHNPHLQDAEDYERVVRVARPRDVKRLAVLFKPEFLEGYATAARSNREAAWAKVSEMVLDRVAGFVFGRVARKDRHNEGSDALLLHLKPIWNLMHPAQRTPEAVNDAVARAIGDSIPF